MLYAGDQEDRLPYNLGMTEGGLRTPLNWVNNVMTWDLSPDNTNTATITGASLGPYSGSTGIYRCPVRPGAEHDPEAPPAGTGASAVTP